jgi:two-component system alkaline phosphatase synthesis response regulator PhoP
MSRKILIVEDERSILILLRYTLEGLQERGVELLLAANGQAGLDLALTESPDLILLDVAMPHLNGYEVCQRIKAVHSETYIILLTARGQAVDIERGTEAGADEYVVKPFDPQYILKRATTVLGFN